MRVIESAVIPVSPAVSGAPDSFYPHGLAMVPTFDDAPPPATVEPSTEATFLALSS